MKAQMGRYRKSADKADDRVLVPKSTGGEVSVVLAHPSTYAVGMSSLGYQVVWDIFNSIPGVWVERAFAGDMRNKPPRSFESGRHASDFDIVAFSLSYEPDAVNMVRFLAKSGIPTETRKRHAKDPVIVVGGIVPTLNPEPYSDFVDLFILGEAEEALPELMERLVEFRGASRTRLLAEATRVEGVYAPKLYDVKYGPGIANIDRAPRRPEAPEKIRRRLTSDIDRRSARSVFYAPASNFGDMGLLEIARGCARGCRFCAAGHIMRPPRFRSVKSLAKDMDFLKGNFDRIGLVASTATDHPKLKTILEMAKARELTVSFASLPAESITGEIIEATGGEIKTLTIAPETGTEKLRRVVNKNVSNEEIIDAAFIAAEAGIKRIKMYFLVGLPGENGDDVAAIGELTRLVAESTRRAKKNVEIVASVAPFVPKAHTPFGLHPMENAKVIDSRLAEVAGFVRKIPGATVRREPVAEAVFQALLSRGDRRAGAFIKKALAEGGSMKRAIRDLPKWAVDTLYAQRTIDQPTPWSFIDDRIGNRYIISEYHQGLLGRISKPCKPSRCAICDACGNIRKP